MPANPYEQLNQKLKEDSERIFRNSSIDEQDREQLRKTAESAKYILTQIESNEATDFLQDFLTFVIKLCR